MNIGLLGAGTVGTALARLLASRRELPLRIAKVLVRNPDLPREGLSAAQLTSDAQQVLDEAEVLVELMGGTGLAGDLILQALERGRRVVTANKAALAERWQELGPYLSAGQLYFEAAVMAGTPVIGPLTGALRGSSPLELHAILNGTCSYMLDEMERGRPYAQALAEAQRLGYAEADPSLDVGGYDAAHKLTVLARLAFDPQLSWESVRAATVGIERLTPEALRAARARGGCIRLLGSVYPQDGRWQARVRPVFLRAGHPLAAAAVSRNALYFRGDAVGEVLITGAGAGGAATASGVLSDLLAACAERPGPSLLSAAAPVPEREAEPLEDAL